VKLRLTQTTDFISQGVNDMRKTILVATAVAALALPIAALADTAAPTPASSAAELCKQQKDGMGAGPFAALYGTNASKANAFGKCVSKNAKLAAADVTNAAKACATERASDAAAFATKYGTNGKAGSKGADKNAFGKCVSGAVKQSTTAQAAKVAAAAASCKAAKKADAATFAKNYSSFGKCVSAAAKTK
jgi:hypothetical protein